jgi:4-hydroxybenzoate polyprenyltransferase
VTTAAPAPPPHPVAAPRFAAWVTLVRPQQWYKNLILFAGVLFAIEFLNLDLVARVTLGFFIFCLASGGVYALNDAFDAKADRTHPVKARRPVAAGTISVQAATVFGILCILLAVAAAWTLKPSFGGTLLAYLALQALYIPILKHKVFLDLFSIALGLILRAIAGVVIAGLYPSPWLLLCTFFLALFLGLGKRRSEIQMLGTAASQHRPSLTHYSEPLVNQSLNVVMAASVLSYSMYTFFHENQWMMLTIPFVLYGMFRYLFLAIQKGHGGEPEEIFHDVASVVNFGLWILAVALVLYLGADWFMAVWDRMV